MSKNGVAEGGCSFRLWNPSGAEAETTSAEFKNCALPGLLQKEQCLYLVSS